MGDLGRFETHYNKDKAVVDTDLPMQIEPNWDVYKNDHFALRKRCLDMFLKNVNQLITRHRAGRRLD